MMFHENCLLADDSHVIPILFLSKILGQMSQSLLSAAVVIGPLRDEIQTGQFRTHCIVHPANRDWACQTERCHTLSNKTSLQ